MKNWIFKIAIQVIGAIAFFGIFKLFMIYNSFENAVLWALALITVFVLNKENK